MDFKIVIIIVIVLLLILFLIYNYLVKLSNRCNNAWSNIDNQLKRRIDLIPNLVETVKGYAAHEKDTLEAVVSARNKAVSATTPEAEMQANGELSQALGRLFALTEAYPDLKANTNFVDLQNQLKETEDKISYSRQFYNDTVLKYQNKKESFPSNIIAGMFGFKTFKFFEAEEQDRKVPEVKF